MRNFRYDIQLFEFSKDSNCFQANEENLLMEGHSNPFPNQGKQFWIDNRKTGCFRRFRLVDQTSEVFNFISEDGIKAVITKTKNKSDDSN